MGTTDLRQAQESVLELAFWEVELLALTASGRTRESVAREFGISERTVRRRIQAWCEQIGAADVTQLVAWAVQVELIWMPVRPSRICIGYAQDRVTIWADRLTKHGAAMVRFTPGNIRSSPPVCSPEQAAGSTVTHHTSSSKS